MFFFIMGQQDFHSNVKGYENVVCQCHNCGNWRAHVQKTRPFFTFCFVPVIPFTIKGYEDIHCTVCKFDQPLTHRPDVQQRRYEQQPAWNGHGGPPPQGVSPPTMHGVQQQPQQPSGERWG